MEDRAWASSRRRSAARPSTTATTWAYTLPGGREYSPSGGLAGALRAAAQRGDMAEVARLTAEARAASPAGADPLAPAAPADVDTQLERLERLGQLRASGVLTEAEFEAQKARILEE